MTYRQALVKLAEMRALRPGEKWHISVLHDKNGHPQWAIVAFADGLPS